MPSSTLTSKYQTTIPRAVRDLLALGAGDRVEFILSPDGAVTLRKAAAPKVEIQAVESTLSPEWDSGEDNAAFAEL